MKITDAIQLSLKGYSKDDITKIKELEKKDDSFIELAKEKSIDEVMALAEMFDETEDESGDESKDESEDESEDESKDESIKHNSDDLKLIEEQKKKIKELQQDNRNKDISGQQDKIDLVDTIRAII